MYRMKHYYAIKPLIPRRIQILLRRQLIYYKKKQYAHQWPIDYSSNKRPLNFNEWPHNKKFALILTHDVDTKIGYTKCYQLATLEKEFGFRSSFNFVPKKYEVSPELLNNLLKDGFEIGVHGLFHDGKLYNTKQIFNKRAKEINRYLEQWGSVGFRSPAMHHNLQWLHRLNIIYDASTFDTDPFQPQSDGVGTIYPFWVNDNSSQRGYVELPYTLPQDFTLFILMKEKNIDIWKKKLDWIVQNKGMVLVNTHPDYMNYNSNERHFEKYPVSYYQELLSYINEKYYNQYWHVLPKDIADYFYKK